ncbi:3-hydroxyanthranilate 3,4-dioxygenase-like [Oppia nitens]|uniref:3-hydroxyanthranilate 3,4-dioxygenase-like n=1 Tax=Oppia nitens TaxID=1686743 RepID=UPI0023DC5BF4|nr:3-hydroxyanthranilate 3,4-dioxygenase-like [Oppia nitens]
MSLNIINMNDWIVGNKQYFLPPICNKLLYTNQLKVFFVGGPNQRKDYHIEEGEELFYQIKGDMCLKVIHNKKPKDIIIREGQVFLLGPRIPHSPQRFPNTIGLVIERERLKEEWDALRYFVDNSTDILYERWFYCQDLGSQLAPIIQEFQASDECKSGKPSENSKLRDAPYSDDSSQSLRTPFQLTEWLNKNTKYIDENGFKSLFDGKSQSTVVVYGGHQTHAFNTQSSEIFVLQLINESKIQFNGNYQQLMTGNMVLIPKHTSCSLVSLMGSYTLTVSMPSMSSKSHQK